jgi:hypothetical protein
MVYVVSRAPLGRNQQILYSVERPHNLAIFKNIRQAETEFARLIAYICIERTVTDRPLSLFAPPRIDYTYSIYKIPKKILNDGIVFNPRDNDNITRIISLNTEQKDFCNKYTAGNRIKKEVIRREIIKSLRGMGLPDDFIITEILSLIQ